MNQLVLSNNLSDITAEINVWKQTAGQAVFEIGYRLKHVKENDLVHGQWIAWLESIEIEPRTAQRMIQAYEQFGNTTHASHLPTGKIFELLSLPSSVDRNEFVQKEHIIPSTGETKQFDDLSREQLREVTKQYKEAEKQAKEAVERAAKAEQDALHWQGVARSAQNKPPRIETKTVEVVPQDYNDLKQQAVAAQKLNGEVVQLKRANETMRQQYEEKLSQQQKTEYAKKELQKYLSEHIRALTMNHDSAVFNYASIQGDREAHEMVMRFLQQYESIVKTQFSEWEQLTTIRAVK